MIPGARAIRTALASLALALFVTASTAQTAVSERSADPRSRLADCPSSPNCVSSLAGDAARRVAPFRYVGALEDARRRLEAVLTQLPRTRFVESSPTYWHLECRSLIFRFVDDLEFAFDPDAAEIHVRSASRVGHSDLGVNRRRVEWIRERFERLSASAAP